MLFRSENEVQGLPGVVNNRDEKEQIKAFLIGLLNGTIPIEFPLPSGVSMTEITGDLINLAAAWSVLDNFSPELTVVNTFNLDICHSNFSDYIRFLHKADYGVGWLWNKIQSHPVMADNTILICMPEHGRNLQPNSLTDSNGLAAFDHTSDDNSREIFAVIAGPQGVVKQGVVAGTASDPVGESVDIVPTIAHILGFLDKIPSGRLAGQVLTQAFV